MWIRPAEVNLSLLLSSMLNVAPEWFKNRSVNCEPFFFCSLHAGVEMYIQHYSTSATSGNWICHARLRLHLLFFIRVLHSKAGISEMFEGHHGPITGIHCHTAPGPLDFSHLFVTSSFDWTVKLWSTKVWASGLFDLFEKTHLCVGKSFYKVPYNPAIVRFQLYYSSE